MHEGGKVCVCWGERDTKEQQVVLNNYFWNYAVNILEAKVLRELLSADYYIS